MRPAEFIRPPMSHPYDYFQMRQTALLREAEHERLIRAVISKQSRSKFYHGWVRWLGLRMISWGEHMARVQHISSATKQTI